MSDDVLAVITPSPARRGLAMFMIVALGLLLLYLALVNPPAGLFWRVFLVAAGLGAILLADKVRRATTVSLELTADGLRDSSGTVLCRMNEIAAVERGAFAFKPSNGFVLRLKAPVGRAWQPGLWWRFGRKLVVGGVTAASQARLMADVIAMKIAKTGPDGPRLAR